MRVYQRLLPHTRRRASAPRPITPDDNEGLRRLAVSSCESTYADDTNDVFTIISRSIHR
jgi:hypothetical protein